MPPQARCLSIVCLLCFWLFTSASVLGDETDLSALLEEVSPPAPQATVEIPFKEARSYPFRKYPKNFSGTIRWSPDGVVTVAYTFPSTYEIQLGPDGARLLQDDGSERDLGDPAGLALLRDLIRWDTDAIAQQWTLVSSEANDGQTQIMLKPNTPTMVNRIKSIAITSSPRGVSSVRVDQKDSIRREYTFGPAETLSDEK